MTAERLYRPNILLALAEPEAFADRTHPTAAELNNTDLVHNITCALTEDDTEFTLGDPDTDDSLTFCSEAGYSEETFDNPTVTFAALRDKTRKSSTTTGADGEFNLALYLMGWKDKSYIAIKRVGFASDVDFAEGQTVSMVAVKTDLPADLVGSGDNARIQQNFLNDGFVNWNFTVAA